MKQSLTMLIFLASLSYAYSQTPLDNAFTAFKSYYDQNALVYPKADLLLNKAEKLIDLGSYQVPINEMNVKYDASPEWHCVLFKCIEGNCIILNEPNVIKEEGKNSIKGSKSEIGIPFKTKENCYKWIELFSKVKEEVNKE